MKKYNTNDLIELRKCFIILRENQHLFNGGLCNWIGNCNAIGIMSSRDRQLIEDYVYYNKPLTLFTILHTFTKRIYFFYWEKDDIKPRLKYINKHIKLLEKRIKDR